MNVVLGMSGGVDSSVSAQLLKEQGHNISGMFMKNWEADDTDEYCSSRQDLIDAVAVADRLEIDIDVINFSQNYQERVFALFLQEYAAGRTPNPDILCNSEIKFKAFLDHALNQGADKIATGHYAGIREENGLFLLTKGIDNTKDQSYFLHRLNQYQLSKSLFPLGNIHKSKVRELALQLELGNATKKDSTGICFIGERPFRDFLSQYLPTKSGLIKTDKDEVIGEHIGLSFYTIGQRKGIGIGGQKTGNGEAWFVAKKDLENNVLYVVQGQNHSWLLQKVIDCVDFHWTIDSIDNLKYISHLNILNHAHISFTAKTRYRQKDLECFLTYYDESTKQARFEFSQPQWAVTAGQSLVLYHQDICLGGGIIV